MEINQRPAKNSSPPQYPQYRIRPFRRTTGLTLKTWTTRLRHLLYKNTVKQPLIQHRSGCSYTYALPSFFLERLFVSLIVTYLFWETDCHFFDRREFLRWEAFGLAGPDFLFDRATNWRAPYSSRTSSAIRSDNSWKWISPSDILFSKTSL